eukprot:Gb_11013 [translate_table: standard]
MAHGGSTEWTGRVKCSYKRATMVICTGNLVAALYVLHSLLSPLYIFSSSMSISDGSHSFQAAKYSEDELKRMSESIRVRRASEPVDLIRRVVKEIQEESFREEVREKRSQSTKENLAKELLQRLKEIKADGNVNEEQALEEWRKKKLEEAKKREATKASTNSIMQAEDTEDGIIPGRSLPPECHAEAHTDYDGVAVRWGLTHHKESAADCCQACLDQAKHAREGEKKCNIWVYCASETGCYSPDIYEHKHQECWLKQADHPKLNFKGKYTGAYRREHPTAPVVVPWVSGVTGG